LKATLLALLLKLGAEDPVGTIRDEKGQIKGQTIYISFDNRTLKINGQGIGHRMRNRYVPQGSAIFN
jgi:hypothetical protein